MTLVSALLLMLLVMDPLGNVPLLLVLLENVPPERRKRILLRESAFALGFLLVFLYLGRYLLGMLGISQEALGIAGGVVLFLIALRMVFPTPGGLFGAAPKGEPFIVPIAIPLIAGPSALATVMLIATREPSRLLAWTAALAGAWSVSTLVLVSAEGLRRVLRPRGLVAIERLMGMILMTVAVQMLLSGIREFLGS
ncbi:MAG: MarC family protein [Candidatus Bipolaricaulota bacterium]